MFSLFSIPVESLSLEQVLEKIKKFTFQPIGLFHIVSLNPENIVISQTNKQFFYVLQSNQIALIDGIGVFVTARLCGLPTKERITGVDLFQMLLKLAGEMSLRVLLIGAKAKIAESIADCYSRSYPKATFVGIQGYQNISKPTEHEEIQVRSIVSTIRPHFIFTAFGSPAQELWFSSHKDMLQGIIYMGVGGGFNYVSGLSKRPGKLIQTLGLEWLYRVIHEPYRAKRQISRLPVFISLSMKHILSCIMHKTTHGTTHQKRY